MFFVIKHYRGHVLIQLGRSVSTDRVCAVWSKVIVELLRVVSSFIKLLSPLLLVRPLKRLPITWSLAPSRHAQPFSMAECKEGDDT